MIVLPIFLITLILQLFLPWWIIGVTAFAIAGLQAKSGKEAFKCGFTAIFLLWFMMSLWKSIPNDNLLANRVGQMLMLPDWSFNWIFVLLITAIIGGLSAGFAALSGFFAREAFMKRRNKN